MKRGKAEITSLSNHKKSKGANRGTSLDRTIPNVNTSNDLEKASNLSYFLMKSEPHVFSIDDLDRSNNKTTGWEGVRNFQARNIMRAMKKGDKCFFYHSNAGKETGIVELWRW